MTPEDLGLPAKYDLSTFEHDMMNVKPRIFDTYILPPFMLLYAYKSKGMSKVARRILFASGIYMFYRNYAEYKAAIVKVSQLSTYKVAS